MGDASSSSELSVPLLGDMAHSSREERGEKETKKNDMNEKNEKNDTSHNSELLYCYLALDMFGGALILNAG